MRRDTTERPSDGSAASGTAACALQPIDVEQAPVLDNLFELYAHDFSEHVPLALAPDGRFHVGGGDRWWKEPGYSPFLIWRGEVLSGFAIAQRGSRVTGAREVMDVAEFFVVRGSRRQGVGATAASQLLARFPGPWEVRVRESNSGAQAFWTVALERCNGRPPLREAISMGGVAWVLFR